MKKYLVELDENLVKYINYLQQDVNSGCLTSNEEYLNGYEALLSQLSDNLECVDESLTYFTEEELKMIHGRMEVEHGWGNDVYTDEELKTMKGIMSLIESFDCYALNFGIKKEEEPTAQLITPVNKQEYDQAQLDAAIERANEELAECIGMLHNCKNLQEVDELVDSKHNDMHFGNESYSDKDYIGICYKSIQFDVIMCSDGSGIYIAADKVQVFNDEGHEIWTGTLCEEGVTGVASQDEANIYLKPDETPEQPQVTNNDDLDLSEYCPMDDDGESCFMLENDSNRNFYLSVFVDKSFDQFSWKLYDEDYKLIDSDWQCGVFESSWMELFYPDSTGIGDQTGKVTFICNLSPKVFHHLLQA